MNARREAVLREMGLAPLWKLRQAIEADDIVDEGLQAAPEAVATSVPQKLERPSALPLPRRSPEPRTQPEPVAEKVAPLPDMAERRKRIAALDWDELEADIRACTSCRLCEQRKQAVPGVGDRNAEVMFVGEGPGAEEDRRGEPFVGAAGQLLDAMLASIGLQRQQGVYIANTVKCRPPHNRTPEADEMAACRPYLDRQIELVKPRLLVALGRPAAQVLLDSPDVRIGAARRQTFSHAGIPVLVTYHPAYLLRNQADKARSWEDLCRARALLQKAPQEN